jgi:hydrogenase maturation factor HypF (carbamoyltransferase family)
MLVASAQYRKHHAHLLSVMAESECRKRERLVGIFLQENVEFADGEDQAKKVNKKDAST